MNMNGTLEEHLGPREVDSKKENAIRVKGQKDKKDAIVDFIYIHFRTPEEVLEFSRFAEAFRNIPVDPVSGKYVCEITYNDTKEKSKRRKKKTSGRNLDLEKVKKEEFWHRHWKNMPSFIQKELPPYQTLKLIAYPRDIISNLIGQKIEIKTKSIWHPKLTIDANRKKRWIISDGHEEKMPRYPLYIVSKGRYEKNIRGTANSLERMRVPFYMVVEQQEYDKYLETADPDYCTVIVLDNQYKIDYDTFDGIDYKTNPRVGPGAARNFAWDHAKNNGFDRYWVFDDNIDDFYRLHENFRIRVESGVMFRACEDFVDRYENIPVSGLQYRFFVAPGQKYPPFVFNTRVYSALLIDTNMEQYKWRGRYNEDTDLTLRVLKDGLCTCQFNAFLIGKAATQTTKGGNTDEFYAVEDQEDVVLHGTSNKSDMLKEMHPDVTNNVWKYGRWHHHVNYLLFKKNKSIMKKGLKLKDEINNYGLELITNYEF